MIFVILFYKLYDYHVTSSCDRPNPFLLFYLPFFNKSRIEAFWIKQNLVKHVKHNRDMEIYF